MCGVGRMDAYVIGAEQKGESMCERGDDGKGQGHINKDLANIMIMFGHSPEPLLAGSSTPKQTEMEGKLSGSVTLSFQAKKEHLIGGFMARRRAIWCACGWSSVQDLL